MTSIPSSRAKSRDSVELTIAFAAGFFASAEFILSQRSESNGLRSE
jgi:hypothetical protein